MILCIWNLIKTVDTTLDG